ncbi:MAG: hypothetical protein ACKOKE_07785 [Actinomycetota bacterium]
MSAGRSYAVAFVAVFAAAAFLGWAGLGSLRSTAALWTSIACSAIGAVAGIAALGRGRRR